MKRLRWIPIVLSAVLLVGAIVIFPAESDVYVPGPSMSRPLDRIEAYEALVEGSQLLLIARVTGIDSTTVPVPGFPGTNYRRCRLEPVEWLRGGLDGDQVEGLIHDSGFYEAGRHHTWASLLGADSLGVLVRLQSAGPNWIVSAWRDGPEVFGARVLPQTEFLGVRDSIVLARERMSVDSLVARADLIVVAADSADIVMNAKQDRGTVRVVRQLKGKDPAPSIRPWQHYKIAAREVLFLKRVGRGLYEPLPFHASSPLEFNDWDSEWERQPFATETAVRRALERLDAGRSAGH